MFFFHCVHYCSIKTTRCHIGYQPTRTHTHVHQRATTINQQLYIPKRLFIVVLISSETLYPILLYTNPLLPSLYLYASSQNSILLISQQAIHLQSIRVQFWKWYNEIYTPAALARPNKHFKQKNCQWSPSDHGLHWQ